MVYRQAAQHQGLAVELGRQLSIRLRFKYIFYTGPQQALPLSGVKRESSGSEAGQGKVGACYAMFYTCNRIKNMDARTGNSIKKVVIFQGYAHTNQVHFLQHSNRQGVFRIKTVHNAKLGLDWLDQETRTLNKTQHSIEIEQNSYVLYTTTHSDQCIILYFFFSIV